MTEFPFKYWSVPHTVTVGLQKTLNIANESYRPLLTCLTLTVPILKKHSAHSAVYVLLHSLKEHEGELMTEFSFFGL